MVNILAHADEVVNSGSASLLETVSHQPLLVTLSFGFFVLLGWFGILGLFGIKLINRLLATLSVVLALAVLFFAHNPLVATVLLSAGFILVFILVFTLLRADKS